MDHKPGNTDSDTYAHSPSTGGTDQKVWSSTAIPADSEGHDHGHRQVEDHLGPDKSALVRDEGTIWHQLNAKVTSGPTPGQDIGGTLTKVIIPPLRPLLNPAAACYELSGHWWFGAHGRLTTQGEPLLLGADGQWTTFLSTWPEPFRQHDVIDFAHCLLQQLNPNFLRCCWESRLEQDGEIRVVDQSALGCPAHLYICSEQKNAMLPTDLQGLLSNGRVASFGLHGLTEPADVTCLHIDRFDSRGGKAGLDSCGILRCGSPFSWTPSWALTTFLLRSLQSHIT